MAHTPTDVNVNVHLNLEGLSAAVDVLIPEIDKLFKLGLDSRDATAIALELIRS